MDMIHIQSVYLFITISNIHNHCFDNKKHLPGNDLYLGSVAPILSSFLCALFSAEQ